MSVDSPRTDDKLVAAEAERPARTLRGPVGIGVSVAAAALSAYALWNVFSPVAVLAYRITFLAPVLALTFLLYRPALRLLPGASNSDQPGVSTDCWPRRRCS